MTIMVAHHIEPYRAGAAEDLMNRFIAFLLLPGRVISWAEYMFPRRGDVWASGRRKDSVMVHALFSLIFWGVLGWLALSAVSSHMSAPLQPTPDGQSSPAALASEEPNLPDRPAAEDVTPSETTENGEVATPEGQPGTDTEASPAAPAEATLPPLSQLTLARVPELQRAAEQALESGHARRWKSDLVQAKGYAVVSEAQRSAGGSCRTLYFSATRSGEDWRSDDLVFCKPEGATTWKAD